MTFVLSLCQALNIYNIYYIYVKNIFFNDDGWQGYKVLKPIFLSVQAKNSVPL